MKLPSPVTPCSPLISSITQAFLLSPLPPVFLSVNFHTRGMVTAVEPSSQGLRQMCVKWLGQPVFITDQLAFDEGDTPA